MLSPQKQITKRYSANTIAQFFQKIVFAKFTADLTGPIRTSIVVMTAIDMRV